LRDLVSQGLERMQAGLDVKDPAVAAEARRVLALLDNDAWLMSGMARSFEGTITARRQYSEGFTRLGLPGTRYAFGWVLGPLAKETWARGLDQSGAMIAAFRATNLPQFTALSGKIPTLPMYDEQTTLLNLAGYSTASLGTRFEKMLEVVAQGRAMAVLLAARLHAAEHGSLPERLEELRGELGGRLPVDPFVEGDQPLHYRLDSGGPTVWSVGRDGVDDHGDKIKDLVYGAANPAAAPPFRPAPPPTTRRPSTRVTTRGSATMR
jgi:hypothetical protein